MTETADGRSRTSQNSGVQSVERVLDILDLLSRSDAEMGVQDIGKAVGLAKGTAHRLLSTLASHGYVRQDHDSRKYTLGLKSLLLASAAREWLGPVARPFLKELVEVSQETANLSGLEKNSIIYIDQVASPRMVQTFIQPGNRAPVHTTGSGKVLLAHQPEEVIETMIQRTGLPRLTSNTITDFEQLKGELDRVRRQGYATDLEETEEGIRALAAPIFSPDGKILVAVSIAGPAGRLSQARIEELVPHIKRIAAAFSDSLKSSS